MSEYDNTNKGALFGAANQTVLRQGPLDIEGEEKRMAIIHSKTKDGYDQYNIYVEVGRIFKNEEKRDEKDADYSGDFTFGKVFKLWGRKRTSKKGMEFLSVSIAPKKITGSNIAEDEPVNEDLSKDDIPF